MPLYHYALHLKYPHYKFLLDQNFQEYHRKWIIGFQGFPVGMQYPYAGSESNNSSHVSQ